MFDFEIVKLGIAKRNLIGISDYAIQLTKVIFRWPR